jgi:hypothetical protein
MSITEMTNLFEKSELKSLKVKKYLDGMVFSMDAMK